MKVYSSIEQFPKNVFSVITTGTFDGVHLGHQRILNQLNQTAKKYNGESVILTFHPHPRKVLYNDSDFKLLTTRSEKIELLTKQGINHLIIHPFTMDFSRLSSIEFIRDILIDKINTKKLIIGYNHHFGRNREGTFNHLQECSDLYGFQVEEIPAFEIDKINVSSTKIRNSLEEGKVSLSSELLGRNYSFQGRVIKGHQIGSTLGFPTANILIKETYKLIPKNGVYAVNVRITKNTYLGMLNIGYRPTFNGDDLTIEVHLFDFKEDIYGSLITVDLIARIRDEKKFKSEEELRNQLVIDRNKVLKILS